ncbi:MAG: type II secretion system GspH family protein [Candidatus Omnitrophica bacterium]|nr:type II secretion system GspH family protein [Candidatus Omnitrophota bacterium]MBU1870410.1 type II secretion system GspH family protein [Candidatus Omnitrophota bacterium]
MERNPTIVKNPFMLKKYFAAMTLIELLFALVLFSIIVLAIGSIESFSRYQVVGSDRRAKLQNEAMLVLEHMSKNAARATGDSTHPVFSQGPTPYAGEVMTIMNIDPNNPPTPGNYTDDIPVGYSLDMRAGHNGELFFCPNANFDHRAGQDGGPDRHEILAKHIPSDGFVVNLINDALTNQPIGLDISIISRWRVDEGQSLDNPQVRMRTKVHSRSVSTR